MASGMERRQKRDKSVPLNPNGVGSLLTEWRLAVCSGLRAEQHREEEGDEEGNKKGEIYPKVPWKPPN